jgi:hypothetical protein
MHKLFISLLALSFALLGACGGGDNVRSRNKPSGMTNADYDRLLKINRMQQDNIDAREAAYSIRPALSEKSKAMSEKIAYPNCVKSGNLPENDLTGVIQEETISSPGATCPIYWYRRRGWTVADKIMVMTDNLQIRDEKYIKELSRMSVRSMSGTYKIIPENGGTRVSGAITINNFQTTDYGRITGGIAINATKNGDQGGGSVILSLNGNRWGITGSVTWQIRNGVRQDVAYRANNTKVDKEQFNSLFSSYELDKYMDNAINMK